MQSIRIDLNNDKLAKRLSEETDEAWTAERISNALNTLDPAVLQETALEAILEYITEAEF